MTEHETKPEDAALFSLVISAVLEGLAYVKEWKDKGEYVGTHTNFPQLSWNENGMPNINRTDTGGPPDYHTLFRPSLFGIVGEILGDGKPDFKPGNRTAFRALFDYIRSKQTLRKRFPPFPPISDLAGDSTFQFWVSFMVEDLIDRYIQIYGDFQLSEGNFIPIYRPIEVTLTQDKLPVDIYVPILFLRFESDEVSIEDNLRIVRMTDEFQLARAWELADGRGIDEIVKFSATHALVLEGYSFPNDDFHSWRTVFNLSAYPLEKINLFFAMLRIVAGVDTGFAQLVLNPIGWARDYHANLPKVEGTATRRYPAKFETFGWNATVPLITDQQIAETVGLWAKLSDALKMESGNRLSLAIQRLNNCFLREEEEDAILDATVAMEVLLSDDDQQEISHKLAFRMAAISRLAKASEDSPIAVFHNIKKVYGFRSALVHGNVKALAKRKEITAKDKPNVPTVTVAVKYLRMALKAIIENPQYLRPSAIDELLLLNAGGDESTRLLDAMGKDVRNPV